MNIRRIRNGVILVSAGVVLLMNTTDHLPWTVWMNIFSLWPIVLVAIGIELLFKRTKLAFLAILSPLLFLTAILGPAFFFETDFGRMHRTSETYLWSQDLDSALTKATAIIQLKAGDLKLSSGTDKLISAELDYRDRKPLVSYERSNTDSSATVEIKDSGRTRRGWSLSNGCFWGGWEKKNWEIRLTNSIPIDLRVDTKAGKTTLDLSDLKINDFDLVAKASTLDIKIGNLVNVVTGTIEAKATKLSISLPEDMGLRIENHAKLSSTSFSWITLKERDDVFETPDFDQATRKLTLHVDGSAIKLKINKYQRSEGI